MYLISKLTAFRTRRFNYLKHVGVVILFGLSSHYNFQFLDKPCLGFATKQEITKLAERCSPESLWRIAVALFPTKCSNSSSTLVPSVKKPRSMADMWETSTARNGSASVKSKFLSDIQKLREDSELRTIIHKILSQEEDRLNSAKAWYQKVNKHNEILGLLFRVGAAAMLNTVSVEKDFAFLSRLFSDGHRRRMSPIVSAAYFMGMCTCDDRRALTRKPTSSLR